MSKTLGNFIGLDKIRQRSADLRLRRAALLLLRAAPFGTDLDWTDADFAKSFNELANVRRQLPEPHAEHGRQVPRQAVPPAAAALEDDRSADLDRATERAARATWQAAYRRFELAAVRAAAGRAGPARPTATSTPPSRSSWPRTRRKAARLDTVLNLSAQAIYRGAGRPAARSCRRRPRRGCEQLGVSSRARRWPSCSPRPLPAGHKVGEGVAAVSEGRTAKPMCSLRRNWRTAGTFRFLSFFSPSSATHPVMPPRTRQFRLNRSMKSSTSRDCTRGGVRFVRRASITR